jgi:hypothetical protein
LRSRAYQIAAGTAPELNVKHFQTKHARCDHRRCRQNVISSFGNRGEVAQRGVRLRGELPAQLIDFGDCVLGAVP